MVKVVCFGNDSEGKRLMICIKDVWDIYFTKKVINNGMVYP